MTAPAAPPAPTEDARLGLRARTAAVSLLQRKLILPEVYFDAPWPGEPPITVDLIAIDRDGHGDVHGFAVTNEPRPPADLVRQLIEEVPGHFRWLAFFPTREVGLNLPEVRETLYHPTDMGRVGLIAVRRDEQDDLSAEVIVKPERFRGPKRADVEVLRKANEPEVASHFDD